MHHLLAACEVEGPNLFFFVSSVSTRNKKVIYACIHIIYAFIALTFPRYTYIGSVIIISQQLATTARNLVHLVQKNLRTICQVVVLS